MWESFQPSYKLNISHENPHRWEAVYLQRMWEDVHTKQYLNSSHENPHRWEAFYLQNMWDRFQISYFLNTTHENSHRWEVVILQDLGKDVLISLLWRDIWWNVQANVGGGSVLMFNAQLQNVIFKWHTWRMLRESVHTGEMMSWCWMWTILPWEDVKICLCLSSCWFAHIC